VTTHHAHGKAEGAFGVRMKRTEKTRRRHSTEIIATAIESDHDLHFKHNQDLLLVLIERHRHEHTLAALENEGRLIIN